jgi:tetratricopeptide (TPR) repeat protein
MSLELGDIKQAASCYKKAIDTDTSILRYHFTRGSLLEEMGEKKKALHGYRRLLSILGPDQGHDYLETARDIARLLHERGEYSVFSLILNIHVRQIFFRGKKWSWGGGGGVKRP